MEIWGCCYNCDMKTAKKPDGGWLMQDSEEMQKFLEDYKSYMENTLRPSREEVKSLFTKWKDPNYWGGEQEHSPRQSPIHTVQIRIKRPESVVDKITRKSKDYSDGLCPVSFRKMNDTLAARLVTYFLRNLTLIDGELRKQEEQGLLEISKDDPPIAYMDQDLANRFGLMHLRLGRKESGYVSVHYILRLKNNLIPSESLWFELQVRTMTEHTWGEIEHVLGYKPEKSTSFTIQRQFQILSKLLGAVDELFNLISEELARLQVETEIEETHLLNAENLPRVLHELGVSCAQREIDGLLKLLVSRGVSYVSALRSLRSTRHIDLIISTYTNIEGRPPNNFEFVANLANLAGCENEQEQVDRIKAQIATLKIWLEFQKPKTPNDDKQTT